MRGRPGRFPFAPKGRAVDTTPIEQVSFVFLDVETTGLSARKGDRIVEICARRIRGGSLEAELDTLVDPTREIPAEATRVHGIDASALEGAPTEAEAVVRMAPLFEGAVMVAHNARFDRGFVEDALTRNGHSSPAIEPIDTLAISRRLWIAHPDGHSLGALAGRLGIENRAPHRARGDVGVLIDAWPLLLEAIDRERRPLTCLGDLRAFLEGRCERETALHASEVERPLAIRYLAERAEVRDALLERFDVDGDTLAAEIEGEPRRLRFSKVLRAWLG